MTKRKLTPDELLALQIDSEAKGIKGFSQTSKQSEGSVEAAAIGKQYGSYTPRFSQDKYSRFCTSLFYAIRNGYAEYSSTLNMMGGPKYYKEQSISCADVIADNVECVLNEFTNKGLFSKDKASEILAVVNTELAKYDLGKNGERGLYPLMIKTKIYDNIINNINL